MKYAILCSLALLIAGGTSSADDKKPVKKPKAKKDVPPKLNRIQIRLQPGAAIGRVNTFYRGPNKFYLLRNPKVVKELKIDGDQQKEIAEAQQELNKGRRDLFKNIRNLKPAERVKKIQELTKKAMADSDKKIQEILNKEQVVRLDQIAFQMQGVRAFQNPVIIKKLKITKDQQAEIREVQTTIQKKRQKLFQDLRAGNVDRTKLREKTQGLQAEQQKKTLEVLTKEQQDQYKKMTGKKFDIGRRAGVLRAVPGVRVIPINGKKIQIKRIRVKGNVRPRKAARKQEKKDKGK